jgi:uncharacterized protein (TIGR00297 family)
MALVFALAGPSAFILPLVLLAGGTLLSKLNRDESEKKGRDAFQVLANGIAGCICLLVFICDWQGYGNGRFEHVWFLAYLISFSISISDTFSSETGKFFKGKTVDILRFRTVDSGLSGGVSLAGTLGGLGAAMLCSVLSWGMLEGQVDSALVIGVLGFGGMLTDSMLGSLLQAKYRDEAGRISETPGPGKRLVTGYAWCNNDMVNLLSNVLVTSLFLLFCYA